MNDYHGYPLDDDQWPGRPWWRRSTYFQAWNRIDGKAVHDIDLERNDDRPSEAMARIDRERPLSPPAPMVGQVWMSIKTGQRFMLCSEKDAAATDAEFNILISGPAVALDGSWHSKDAQWAPRAAG